MIVATTLVAPILPWQGSGYVSAASPFVTICSCIATRSIRWMMLAGLPAVIAGVLSRRWFCRYACPVGLILEPVGRARPRGASRVVRWPRIGLWIVLATLGGACAGYPLLLWTDPLVIFSDVIGLPWQRSWGAAAVVAVMAATIVILTVVWAGSWCGKVCPLGATQDLLAHVRRALRRRRESGADEGTNEAVGIPRRSVLAVAAGAIGGALALRHSDAAPSGPLRPPGALPEARFIGVCARCGNCVRACPEDLIKQDVGGYGIASLMTPVVSFREGYCLPSCVACMEACPSGAIVRFPAERKVLATIGEPAVDRERCLLNTTECRRCIAACPYEALRTEWDAEAYEAVLSVNAKRCPGCGACEAACPTKPKAIVVRKTV